MPERKEIIVEQWDVESDSYNALAQFLVKKFVVKQDGGKA